ncbi:MAG TPA: glycosyltransferase [Solirubrobacterales bacterium]|nr:glycosyltransferase [Solirubrobacterales bacterium]
MRVGLLCHSGIGGSVRIATGLACALSWRGHQVHVLARTPPAFDSLGESGVCLHTLPPTPDRDPPGGLKVAWSSDEQAAFRSLVSEVVRAERLDVLHAHYAVPFAHVAAWLVRRLGHRAPVTLATLHGTDVSIHGREPRRRRMLSEDLRTLGVITSVSHHHARLARQVLGLGDLPMVIPNFVDVTRFRPARFRRQGKPRIVHVSNFRGVKDAPSLARVFLAVRERIDAELWLIGDGPGLPVVEAMLAEAGESGAARSFGVTTDVAPILREADLLLMTSYAESFCMAAAEAMACGVPVVATRAGGISEVVGDGATGHLFAVGDHASAAEAVVELLASPRLRRRLGGAARQRATRFAPERVVPIYEGLYHDLLGATAASDQRPAGTAGWAGL